MDGDAAVATPGRLLDRALFATLLVLPLLPAGPAYLGLEPAPFVDGALLVLLALAVVQMLVGERSRAADPGSGSSPAAGAMAAPQATGIDGVGAAWLLFGAAATGAMMIGVAAENEVGSPVFRHQIADLLRLLGPIDRAWEPLLSLHAWFVVLRGLLAYALVRTIIAASPRPRRRARAAVSGWLCGFGVVAGLAVAQYATGYRLHPFWVEVNPLLTRSHATLDDPNALGSFLALGIFVGLGCCLAARAPLPRRLAGFLTVLGGAALLASGSRAALGAVVVISLLAARGMRRRGDPEEAQPGAAAEDAKPGSPSDDATPGLPLASASRLRRVAGWALVALLLIIGASLLARLFVPPSLAGYRPESVVDAVIGTLDPRVPLAEVLENRAVWWDAALRMWRDHPLLGVGLGRFPLLLSAYTDSAASDLDAHGYFLQIAAESGALGFGALLLLLTAIFAALRARRRDEAGFGVAAGVLCGSAAFVATFVSGHPLLLPSGQVLWATLLAAAVTPGPGAASGSRRPVRVPGGAVVAGCGLVVAAYAIGAVATPAPDAAAPWGYSYGLFPQEAGVGGRVYRWTGPLALVQITPPVGARALVVEVEVSPARRAGGPTEVRLFVARDGDGGDFAPRDFVVRSFPDDAEFIAVLTFAAAADVPGAPRTGGAGDLLLRIEVEPAFVPARAQGSADDRVLGVRLRPLRFAGAG